MAAQWHYRRGDEETVGPVGAEELKSLVRAGDLGADDLVWREDMPDWVTVGRIKPLKELIPGAGAAPAAAPPPAVPARAAPPATRPAARPAAARPAAAPPPVVPPPVVPPPPAADVEDDLTPGPNGYKSISITFGVGSTKFYGQAIASDAAIYFVIEYRRNDLANAGGAVGGIIGGLAAALIDAGSSKATGELEMIPAGALPPAVRQHPTWPMKKLKDDANVIVVPKRLVAAPGIVHPRMSNLLKFKAGETPVTIEYKLLRGGKVKAFLEAAGWPLSWGGKPPADLAADAAPGGGRKKLVIAGVAAAVLLAGGVGAYVYFSRLPSMALVDAAKENNVAEILKHKRAGRDMSTASSALYAAAERGHLDATRVLLDAGVNPSGKDPTRNATPAHIAAARDHHELLRVLLERGAEPVAQDGDGYTPLHVAAAGGSVNCTSALLERGAPVDVLDARKQTPLMHAARLQKVECIEVARELLRRGANRGLRDQDGRTAYDCMRRAMSDKPDLRGTFEMTDLLQPGAGTPR